MELNVKELNEPLCFKMHYLTHVVQQASTHKGGPLGWIKWLAAMLYENNIDIYKKVI